MTGLFDEFVPLKTRRCVDSDTPWFDASIGRVVLERDIAYKFWKASRSQHTWDRFKLMRNNRARNTIKYSKRRFMMSHLNLNQPPKRLWRRITDLGPKKVSPIIGDVDVNGLNEFLTSPGPNARGVAFSVLFHDFTPFSFRSVYAQEVVEAVFSIKSEVIGLDNVSLKFVKLLALSLIPITTFFNFCFTHDILPADWKKQDNTVAQNIQPI
jgi:hypothetical protein